MIGYTQCCIAKNGGGYTQTGAAKGLKVPCLFMITEVSIRCQKNPGGWYTPYTRVYPQYITGMYVCICALDTQVLVCFSVGSSAGQESAGTTDVDGRRAFINECNVSMGPRTASCCYQHSG